jgi:hypothetical protein
LVVVVDVVVVVVLSGCAWLYPVSVHYDVGRVQISVYHSLVLRA